MRIYLLPAIALFFVVPVVAQPPSVSTACAYVEKWVAEPSKAGIYTGVFPRFRFTEHLASAIADQDKSLVTALLPLLREANEAEITLLRLELGATKQQADAAATLATNLDKLNDLLSQRPVAGAPDRIERETLAGAALRFHAAAAAARSALPAITRRLEKLASRDVTPLPLSPPELPPSSDPAALAGTSPVLGVLGMIAERRLSSLSGLPHATTPLEAIYVSESGFPQPVIIWLGGRDPLSRQTKASLAQDDRAALEETIALRLDAIASLGTVATALPEDRIRAMSETAELAERQFRQGAISIALFLEAQQGWLETLETRNKAILDLWREIFELQSLIGGQTISASPDPKK